MKPPLLGKTLGMIWTEFRDEVIKGIVGAAVVALGGLALSQWGPVRAFFIAPYQTTALAVAAYCFLAALLSMLVTFAVISKRITALQVDLTAVRAELTVARDEATRDALTNLYSSNRMLPLLTARIDEARTAGKAFSLIMIDIDNFKRINDTYNHDVGNFILRQVADIVNGRSRGDIVCRYGGDEYLIIAKLATRDNEGYGFADRVRRDVAESQFLVEANSHRREALTVSCGVTDFLLAAPKEEEDAGGMLKRVANALKLAKQERSDADGIVRSKNFVYVTKETATNA